MQVDAHAEFGTRSSELPQALYFKSSDKYLFGLLHLPQGEELADVGVVICNPFGYEATCAHRSIRAFAESACNLGITVLRFDYRGTGDSDDIDPSADQLEAWTEDVCSAVAELRRLTGLRQVCVLGIRLGALLAISATQQGAVVDGAILIAPIVNGQKYLRELHRIRLGSNLTAGSDPPPEERGLNASMDVSGFSLSAATVAAIARIQIDHSARPPAPRTLIIDSEDLASPSGWGRELSKNYDDVEYRVLPGLLNMIMASPLRAVVPVSMVAAVCEWLKSVAGTCPPIRPPAATNRIEIADITLTLTMAGHSPTQGACVTERPAFVSSRALLFGIVSEPPFDARNRHGVIFLNTGADYHIGANRLHVSLARRWAGNGYVVMRIDLGGLGDSATLAGSTNDEVFPTEAFDDVRATINYLRSRYGLEGITLCGICSGAYHALRSAAANLPVQQILMVNPQNYFWTKGMRIDELQLAEVVRYPTEYLHRLFSLASWRQLLSGGVNFPRVALVYVKRLFLAFDSTIRDLARFWRIRLPQDLASDLEAIAARGVRMSFIFARNEPGMTLLRLQAGSSIGRLGNSCRIHILKDGDHIFSDRKHRAVLENLLTNELYGSAATEIDGSSSQNKTTGGVKAIKTPVDY